MHRIYPTALIACMIDDRTPRDGEIRDVAARMWNDGFFKALRALVE
jgi:hypothetical protein